MTESKQAQLVTEAQLNVPLELLISAREVEEEEMQKALAIINPMFNEANKKDYELRVAIKEGRLTTGNPYRDFFIVYHSGKDFLGDKYKKLEDVDHKANASESKLMLITRPNDVDYMILFKLIKYENPALILNLDQETTLLRSRLPKNYWIQDKKDNLRSLMPSDWTSVHVLINSTKYIETSIHQQEDGKESSYALRKHENLTPLNGKAVLSLHDFYGEEKLFLIGKKEICDYFKGKGCEKDYNLMIKSLERTALKNNR